MTRRALFARRTWLMPLGATLLLCCQGAIGDGGPDDSPNNPPNLGEMELQAPVLPRLTNLQYLNAIHDLLGDGLPAVPLEPDTNPYLFYSIGAASTAISELGVQQLEEAADALTTAVFSDPTRRASLVGCEPISTTDSCASEFITAFGRRAFRRPLTSAETTRWASVASDLGGADAWLGLRMVVAGMLQSPNFVYRVELGEPDPTDGTRFRYTSWEMASRLAFSLRNTTPDDELLDAAERGDLLTPAGIDTQARRLLEGERARQNIQEFFAQYFDLSRLDGLTRDQATYPSFSPTMPESMRAEVKLLVDDFVIRRDADVRGVFSTRRTFVNTELAALYGVEAEGATPVTFVPVELPDDGPRAGLLTLGAFLAMNAHETDTSPTLRGKYVRERVLCQEVPAPPDNVNLDLSPQPGEPPATLRERLEQHRTNPACAACHEFIDPPGMLFEHFDSAGAWRDQDNGHDIDASGNLDGEALDDARGLANMLVDDERVSRCIVKQIYRNTQSRLDDKGEEVAIDDLDRMFKDSGYRFRELLVQLVSHDSFRFVHALEVSP